MAVTKYPNLKLTGLVLDLHADVKNRPGVDMVPVSEAPPGAETVQIAGETLAIVPAKKPDFAAGDIAIYTKSDAAGRFARRGGHTNFGYSGYFGASVFDGKGWRRLELRDFIPESARNYATQGESGAVRKRLVDAVGALAGRELVYGVRKYGMPGMAQAARPVDGAGSLAE
jgi:hypothetical protein